MAKLTTKGHQVYMDGDKGPFRCDNCKYYPTDGTCNNDKIIKLAGENKFGLSLNGYGLVNVSPSGCSDYFEEK